MKPPRKPEWKRLSPVEAGLMVAPLDNHSRKLVIRMCHQMAGETDLGRNLSPHRQQTNVNPRNPRKR